MARVTRSGKSADNAEVVTKAAPKTGTKRLKKKEVTKTTPKTTTVVKADTDVEDERHDSPHVTPTKTSKRGRKRKSGATEEEPEKAVKRRGRPPNKPKTTAESTIGSTVTSKTSKPSSVVTTSQPSVGRRKRGSNRTDTKSFTQREKKAFYECLQSKGLSCLKNEELLLEVLPNRTITEINAFIDTYSRKAQELNRRSDEAMNGGSNSTSNKQPIEKWFELIHQSIPNASKKDDISAILIDIFGDIKIEDKEPKSEIKSEVNPDLIPDFKQIYGCIKDALDGEYAPPLRPMDAFVMVNLIEELKDLLRSDDYSKETDYLASGKWWSNKKSAEDMFSDIFTRRQQQNAAENVYARHIHSLLNHSLL
ncbi:unnamed protein product [Oppiella nova]|uniref:Uncharacterized protein n=1 Tax=Oppiella nova TaxID=334625 RepID=A0A7R9LRF7_9ACAR|nr:unnamed protein product [Oppiella nova]CAG2166204.1 unnamed protein product [Oppiella nova]